MRYPKAHTGADTAGPALLLHVGEFMETSACLGKRPHLLLPSLISSRAPTWSPIVLWHLENSASSDVDDNSFTLTSYEQSFQESVASEMITFGAKEVFWVGSSLQGPQSLLALEGKQVPRFISLICVRVN